MIKKIIITSIVLAAIAVGAWYGYQHLENEVAPPSTTLQAVPLDAAFVFESRDAHNVWRKLSETNVMWEELKTTEYFAEMNSVGQYLDSLFETNIKLKQLTDKRSIVISAHMSGANDFSFLYCISLPNNVDAGGIEAMLNELSGGQALISQRNYDETAVTQVTIASKDLKFSYCVKGGIFISSASPVLVEKSIRHLNNTNWLTNDYGFVKVQKTAGVDDTDGNLYLNFNAFPSVLATYLNTETKLQALPLQAFGDWAELDLNIRPNGVNMSGFTYSNDTTNNFLNILQHQQPQDIEVTKIVPANTAFMLFYGFSDFNSYYDDYRTFMERNDRLFDYNKQLQKINDECGCDLKAGFNPWIGNEVAMVVTEPTNEDVSQNAYAFFHANNINNAQSKLELLVTQITLKYSEPAALEVHKNQVIKQLRIGRGLEKLLGGAFKSFDSPYYMTVGNYIVMANSQNALRNLINMIEEDRTLNRDLNYSQFADELASEANLFVYSNIARSPNLYKKYLTQEYAKDVDTYLGLYRKFEAIAFQIGTYKDNLFLNNMYLKYNPVYKQETSSLWETLLDTSIASRPQLLVNHTNQTKEVFVQDEKNTIYLIGSTGTVLWQRDLDEKITGAVQQIDTYNNGRLQLLFSTRNKIYVLDRLGRDVTGWPLTLPAPASNSVIALDYDNNKNYRILVACMDNQLYNFDKTGIRVEGWEFPGTAARVTAAVEHFVVNNKDYIFVTDLAGNIYLLDRRGKNRHDAQGKVTGRSKNGFTIELGSDINSSKIVYSDTIGNIVKQQFSGNVERINLGNYSPNHFFVYADLDNDKRPEYILVDNKVLSVFATDQELLFTHTFDSTITQPPVVLKTGTNTYKIGIASEKTDQVFLFNQVGDISEGLPLFGTTLMDIGDMNRDDALNMVCGSIDGHIYTYTLK
jgi:hypothetical protein